MSGMEAGRAWLVSSSGFVPNESQPLATGACLVVPYD